MLQLKADFETSPFVHSELPAHIAPCKALFVQKILAYQLGQYLLKFVAIYPTFNEFRTHFTMTSVLICAIIAHLCQNLGKLLFCHGLKIWIAAMTYCASLRLCDIAGRKELDTFGHIHINR